MPYPTCNFIKYDDVLVGALCADTIDYRRASAMLTALRMASAELRNPTQW